uniref:Uncharacterized protein n=1 Tax=Arundo donax TaxID=35708 RepID=A0A0A8YAJ9_ARUDO
MSRRLRSSSSSRSP